MPPAIEFDPDKDALNRVKHGLSLAEARAFDWATAALVGDARTDYGELRVVAYGMLYGRLHVVVFTDRPPARRIISLRRANRREIKRYATP